MLSVSDQSAVMVVLQATGLVSVLFVCVFHLWTSPGSVLAIYAGLWAIFHLSEYCVLKLYLPRTANCWLFLLFGARGAGNLFAVHLASGIEYWLTKTYWKYHGFPLLGISIALTGITVRGLAIKHCGNSFSHYIETEEPRTLVTEGVYGWVRHPSYLGFILYVMGMQLLFGNIVVYVISMVILFRFFLMRIRLEELVLINNLYGEEYEKYSDRVSALFPLIY